MKLAIMQPYFFPYIGYFQLINAVDEFVLYDNIEFTKKGWINRNRILVNGKDSFITIPLKSDSDYLDINRRRLVATWPKERESILNRITEYYRKSPYFDSAYPVISRCLLHEENNLFRFILNSLALLNEYLGIMTPFLISSTLPIDRDLKADKKVIAICRARQAGVYINPIGGTELYKKDIFRKEGIKLFFLQSHDVQYDQFGNEFVPRLSIIDVMMFNSPGRIREYLSRDYSLV
jgi:hypothetical protein